MKTRSIAILLFVSLLFACNNKNDKDKIEHSYSSENIIPKDKFIDILVDFQIAESTIRHNQKFGINTKTYSDEAYKIVMDKHHISKEDFDCSINYYNEDTELIASIYNEVTNRLSQLLGETRSKNIERTKTDNKKE